MNKAKISASLLIIIAIVATVSFFVVIPKPTQNQAVSSEKSYITSETQTVQNLVVWNLQNILFLVNDTETTYINFYNWTYNETSQIASKELIDSWRTNFTTQIVHNSTNATETIQWAISQSGQIIIKSGNYSITNTLILGSNTELIGDGALLSYYGDSYVILVPSNSTNIRISHLQIDMRGIDTANLFVMEAP